MTLFRAEHNRNYTTINNTIVKDKRLSWKAKGIWLYAFSRPDDWVFHLNDLVKQSADGRDAVKAGLSELEKCGYLQRSQFRSDEGQFQKAEWVFYETPREIKIISPQTGFPSTVLQLTENPPLLSTDLLPSTEKEQQQATQIPVDPGASKSVVVFSKSVEKKEPRPRSYPVLSNVDVPEAFKVDITKSYDESTVRNAITWAQQQKEFKTSREAAIKWACENKPELPKSAASKTEKNKSYAKMYANFKSDHLKIEVLNTCVEFVCGPRCESLKYEDNGFIDQFESILRKFNVVPLKLTETPLP